jgi:hypothetical protein
MKQLYPFLTFIFVVTMACIVASAVDSCRGYEDCLRNYSLETCQAAYGSAPGR